ncbi:hypothetical protein ARHIZOSPH14_18150 [Agromyces rhizosphaerae]|uniref:GTPase n=1 Tax=Agromyces rhizosphaerae TaxID=88374 RepID=A0A9W6FRY1_9MICO|nr:hypothetical protein [Agromyces rhizosphaerae]GLI27573.1 hypothetical protein ARHIZOSPH14_18150 [Agromyces rhizosphaerae]
MNATEYIGVYNADGGPAGEVRYIVGKFLGTAHCSLCDVTHTWRRRPEWDAMVARLGVPFRLLHLNELDDELERAVAHAGSPVVFARVDGALRVALDADQLETAGGSVERFASLLESASPA